MELERNFERIYANAGGTLDMLTGLTLFLMVCIFLVNLDLRESLPQPVDIDRKSLDSTLDTDLDLTIIEAHEVDKPIVEKVAVSRIEPDEKSKNLNQGRCDRVCSCCGAFADRLGLIKKMH